MITTKEYMDDLKFIGDMANKFGLEIELDFIIDAYEKANKEINRTPW